jgi:acyl-CoA dehydrogenase
MHDTDLKDPLYIHDEVFYENVRIPVQNLLGGEGEAFVLAQKRLGPGRIHHSMRWVGVCRRAMDALCERAVSKSVHGSLLAEKQMVQQWVADSMAEIESARLLTLFAAWKIDNFGSSEARVEIAMIKYHGAEVLLNVLDRAIQLHGSLGFSSDMPLENMYRWSRAARLYDGPDEVHKVTVAKKTFKRYTAVDVPTEHIPTRRVAALTKYGSQLEALRS